MKTWLLKALVILPVLAAAGIARCAGQTAATNSPASTNGIGPKIRFDSVTYDFGRVRAGTMVKHDFVFTNDGDATLQINGVTPGCGCTTIGEWTHQVEPGKSGVIPIQFNSSAYGGPVTKTPSLTCNDKSQPLVRFQLHGTVFKPIDITPAYVSINIRPDASEETNAVVHIINNEDAPLVLALPTSSQPTFVAELKTNTPGKNFDLIIKTVPPLKPGNNQALITLGNFTTTNSQAINVFAMASVQPLVAITPPQFMVPAGPLASNETVSVFLRNQGSKPLVLSDPSINIPGATPVVHASQPGQIFTASVEFPAGFQAQPGSPVELSIKTDNDRFPVITIPVRQAHASALAAPQPVRMAQ